MDYYHQQQQQHLMAPAKPDLNLPDASSSSEKALMWSQQAGYMCESGYATQAPSISSIDAFLNNEQQQQQQPPQQQQPVAPEYQQPCYPQQQQPFAKLEPIVETQAPEPAKCDENDNALANWMNNQNNGEMASKAIPELVKLICDEDAVVVKEASILFNTMSRDENTRMAIVQTPGTVQALVNCLITNSDLEVAKILVSTLYSISTQKPLGVQSIIASNALDPLVKLLNVPAETIVSYSITTLHNVLLDCGDNVKNYLRKVGTIQAMVPLLNITPNAKFLSILVDCLQLLAFQHTDSKVAILHAGGIQILVSVLQQFDYPKLLLNTTRLLKVLSCCSQVKSTMISLNAIQILAHHLNSNNYDIVCNSLTAIRNMSDAATRLSGLDPLVQSLLNFLASSKDVALMILSAGILSNLTCNNEYNKKTAVSLNAVPILLTTIQSMIQHPKLVEPCLCALKHITNKHQDMLLAQEQMRSVNGLAVISDLMSMIPRNMMVMKTLLGLIRNFCSNQLNSAHMRQFSIIEKLMQVLYETYTQIQMHGMISLDDTKLTDIIDACSAALIILAKEPTNQLLMKKLDCISFFVQMFYSPVSNIRKAAAILLAELSSSSECALDIEQQPGLLQFVQENFYNQYGNIKTIAELSANGTPNASSTLILQHVSTMMQRLQEHNAQRHMMHHQYQYQPMQPSQSNQSLVQPVMQQQQQPQSQQMRMADGYPNGQTQQQMMYYQQQQQSNQFTNPMQPPQFY